MKYEEWLSLIEELKISPNTEKLEQIKSAPISENINDLLIPKLESLVKDRFKTSISKIINELDSILNDENILDLALINFKKELNMIRELATLKQIPKENQASLIEMLKRETENIYDILIREAQRIDFTGSLNIIINNNRVKWSE